MIKYMKHIVQNIIYSVLIILLLYVFSVHMKIIEGNTNQNGLNFGTTNSMIMDKLYTIEKDIRKIMKKMQI